MQEQPERQAIRQFLDFMRIGDMESAYQAVEKMKFSDFVDALEAVHAKENFGESIEAIGRRHTRSNERVGDMIARAIRKHDP